MNFLANQSDPFGCSDNAFGPTLPNAECRQHGFDFTLLFEESILAILPAALLLCIAPYRFFSIRKRPHAVQWSSLPVLKMATIVTLAVLDLVLLILWSLPKYGSHRTKATVASTAMDLVAVISLGLLSPVEHVKSFRPSSLISVYLLVTTIFDIARVRTLWGIANLSTVASVFTAAFVIKTCLLLLEALSKRGKLRAPASPEQTSGIYSLSFFGWLNPLINSGQKNNLTLEQLYPIDDYITTEGVYNRADAFWASSNKEGDNALAWAIIKAFWRPLLSIWIPKFALIGFNITQPFIVQEAILFVEDPARPDRYGYGLVGAFAFTYLGIAVSTAWYEYLTARALARIRAALVTLIYGSTLDMAVHETKNTSPASLMGADVERVTMRLRWVLSTLPNLIQVALAIYILETRIGAVCVAPVIFILFCTFVSGRITKLVRPRQQLWMKAVQARVATTSDVLGSMRGMKTLGLTKYITKKLQGMRTVELDKCKSFRRVQIVNITVGNASAMITPVVTLLGYGIVLRYSPGESPNAATIFSSLSLLAILIDPFSELVVSVMNLTMALESFTRIQEYVMREKRVDYRVRDRISKDGPDVSDSNVVNTDGNAIDLQGVTGGWHTSENIVKDMDLRLATGSFTMIVGPSGCGKSTLLQIILGEAVLKSGSVSVTPVDFAYCDQTAHLINQSVKRNLIGNLEYDEEWYTTCIRACAFDADIRQLPAGDETLVGSKGTVLSGGQKQRLALARAVYARKKIVLLDDCFSGLDASTETHCMNHLLGVDGLFKRTGSTVVLVTHAVKWLPLSDHIVVMNSEGRISQVGSFQSLSSQPGYVQDLHIEQRKHTNATSAAKENIEETKSKQQVSVKQVIEEPALPHRGRGDSKNFFYYLATLGNANICLFLVLATLQVVSNSISPLWLSWWIDAEQRNSHTSYALWLTIYGMFGVLAIVSLAVSTGFFMIRMIPRSASILHYSVLRSTMNAPVSFLSSIDSGVLLNRFAQDMVLVDMDLPMGLLLCTTSFGGTIASAILTCVSSGYMAICLPGLAVILYYLQKFYLRASRQLRLLDLEAKSPILTHLTESIDGIVTIRAMDQQIPALKRVFELMDVAQRPFYLLMCLQSWLNLALDLAVASLAVLLVGLMIPLRHSMNSSLLGVALVSVLGFGGTMSSFVTQWSSLETSLGAISRTREFIRETPAEMQETEDTAAEWPSSMALDFRNVSASYSSTGPTVLRDINLHIPEGQRVAICGRTGSGKSTLAALILRVLDPASGTITLGNTYLSSLAPDAIRTELTCLPQDPWFLPGKSGTVKENLDPFGKSTDEQLLSALTKSGLTEQVERMGGLDSPLRGTDLSAGQRQLFCLARAMVTQHSRIVVLDEATSSVDEHTEQVMMRLMRTEFKGWTVVAIAHRLASIADFDKVVVLDKGAIVEMGKPSELLRDGSTNFARMYNGGESSGS